MAGVSTLGQVLNQIQSIKSQQTAIGNLSTQLATGRKTQRFEGLGNDIITSQSSRASFDSLESYISNITNGDRRIQLTLSAIEEAQAQSQNFSSSLIGLSQESTHQKGDVIYYDDPLTTEIENTPVGHTSSEPDIAFQTLQDLASNLYDVVVDLINAKDGDRYLLSGADGTTQPLVDTGTLDAAVTSLITQWKDGTISNEELIADITNGDTSSNLDALSDTVIGYSAALSADNVGNVTIRASKTIEVDYTTKANEDPLRDLLVGLAVIKNPDLGPIANSYEPPNTFPGVPDAQGAPGATLDEMKDNFYAIYNSVQSMIENAIDDTDTIRFRLNAERARIDGIKQNHLETQNFLQTTIDEIENVNLDEVAIQISTLQTRLEASYAVTAQVQSISLVNFI